MTPLAKKHWQLFKSQKRAYWSFILFTLIFVISLFAELIANDKPIFVWYKGNAYFPIFQNYTDATFGGSLPTYADYKDQFTKEQIRQNGLIIMPPVEFSYDTINYELDAPAPTPPSLTNPLGTDDQGRDVFARLLYGIRLSVLFGLLLTFFSSLIGIFVGAIQGYFGGKTDLFVQRFLEIWGSLPQMFILIIVSSIFLPGFWSLLIVLLLFSWTSLVGVVRAEFLRCRNFDYVKAARALGVSDMRIMFRHILPNALVASVTYIPFILSGSIVALTALDFLGFGMPVGSASLGELVAQAKENLSAPWLSVCAFVTMAVLLSCLVFIGEGVRFAFDTRAKRSFNESVYKSVPQEKTQKLLSVRHLSVAFGDKTVLHDASFDIQKGQVVALVGESGCGKSVTALSILGLLSNAKVKGSVQLNGQELIGLSDRTMQKIRGRKIALIFQEPMTSLNPLHKIKKQIAEVMQIHFGKVNQARIFELMDLVGLKHDKGRILNSFPYQLSGGQRQRAMIAMALAGDPDLLIADEPTTALDVVLQKQILDLMKDLQKKLGLSVLFISHDKKTVSYMADRIYQVKKGQVRPFVPQKERANHKKISKPTKNVLLTVHDLSVFYGKMEALRHIDFNLMQGQTLGIVGESGSGKSTLANALVRLIKATGNISLCNQNILQLSDKKFNALRRDIQIVFQDPFSSLNPRMTVAQIIAEGLHVHSCKTDAASAVKKVLHEVGLSDEFMNRYPHELSGGQRQRISIARALILNPKVLILDEPTSALDAKNKDLILDLLDKIQKKTNISYLLITHDMDVVAKMSDNVMVLKDGRCVESGPASTILSDPKQEYTRSLLSASFFN